MARGSRSAPKIQHPGSRTLCWCDIRRSRGFIGLLTVAQIPAQTRFPLLTPLTSKGLTRVVIQNIPEARSQDALMWYSIHQIALPVVYVMVRSGNFRGLECPRWGGYSSWEEQYLAALEEAEARSGTAFGRSAKRSTNHSAHLQDTIELGDGCGRLILGRVVAFVVSCETSCIRRLRGNVDESRGPCTRAFLG